MKTLLALAAHPDFAQAVRAAVDPEQYRVVERTNLDEAEPLLAHGLADACLVDVELTGIQGIWLLEKLRRRAPRCPVIVYTTAKQSEWEEEAYLQGATHVLTKPVRRRVLGTVLERLWLTSESTRTPLRMALPSPVEPTKPAETGATLAAAQTLGVLRDFSGILTHSLNAEGMLKQFLLLMREILGINRAVIFLRQPFASFGRAPTVADSRRLRVASAIGLPQGLLQHFELSFEAGIGGHLFRLGRILRRSGQEALQDVEAQKEFELLGAEVAVPILDRETVLGVAVFDGRITGEALVNAELELIFHLLEQLGLAIKNIWLHDQLAGNHEMMAEILREISSACIVVSRDLAVLHANKTARRYFGRAENRSGELEFADLPQLLGARIYQVLKTGTAIPTFKFEPEDAPGSVYNIRVVPFQRQQSDLPASALLTAEDLTQSEQLQHLEIEAANLRLVKSIARGLTHEMGNAIPRLVTYQQLLAEKLKKKAVDQEFLKLMARDWAEDNIRIWRLLSQMRSLNVDGLVSPETFPLVPLLDEAYREACTYPPAKSAQLKYEASAKLVVVSGNRAALKQALAEILHNALQDCNQADPKIRLRSQVAGAANGSQELHLEVQDNGPGFTAEAAQKAFAPFYTTRTVGLGLGLTVALKIIENHRGKLVILPPKAGQGGVLRITLPLDPSLKQQT